jgi:hypothetical protein
MIRWLMNKEVELIKNESFMTQFKDLYGNLPKRPRKTRKLTQSADLSAEI